MVQIIEENRRPKFSDQLMQGLGRAATAGATEIPRMFGQRMQAKQENEAIRNLIGQDISGISDPKMRQQIVEQLMKGQTKGQEDTLPLQAGLETINEMRKIRQRGNLGRGSSIPGFFGGETGRDRGHYQQLGKSLIPLASRIPIRNQKEFETLAANLYDASITDAQAEGVLNAMEQIIRGSLGQSSAMQTELGEVAAERESHKRLDSSAMQKIFHLAKGDKQEAKRIAKKMGYVVE